MSSTRVLQVLKLRNASSAIVIRTQSSLAPSAPLPMSPEEQKFRDNHSTLVRIGNRDIVGFGRSGSYSYIDDLVYPYPAIRWEQNTGETKALMEKAQGDWKNLTIEEKKKLYRHSFCQTFAEIKAPTGEWKFVWAIVFATLTFSCWVYVFMRNFVFDAMLPSTLTKEHQTAVMQRMVAQRQGLIAGIGSKYDYENDRWKKE